MAVTRDRSSLNSTSGDIAEASILVLRGAMASNSGDRTGDAGTSSDGDGGNSGSVGSFRNGKFYAGGTAGDGGKLEITAGGSIDTKEAILATGGDAGALSPATPSGVPNLYYPVTGNGGGGTTVGGKSGSIGIAGLAGKGGSVSISTPPTDRAACGAAHFQSGSHQRQRRSRRYPGPSGFMGFSASFPAGDGVQSGITGNGGDGKAGTGGNAGSVGGGVVGGDGGTIEVSSAGSIISVQDFADGGSGGDQAGKGGSGGQGAGIGSGGNGGSVGGAGNGGDAGAITVKAQEGIALERLRPSAATAATSRRSPRPVMAATDGTRQEMAEAWVLSVMRLI